MNDEQREHPDEPAHEPASHAANEPTQPLFGGPSGPPPPPPTQHLFDHFGGFGHQAAEQPVPASAAPARGRRRGVGLAAGVIAAALVVGGGAGFGGAALYHHSDDSDGGSVFGSAGTTSNVSDQKAPAASQGSVEAVSAKVLPSVVKIEVSGSTEAGSGSGIILSSDGLIMTNNHVVAIAGKSGTIKVDFNDGSQANATIVGTDSLTDTAVIRASGVSNLKPATIGKSSNLAVGQGVVAIGSPFGLDSTVTSGIVSALNRPVNVGSDDQGNATVYPAIQTDAAINPGNSGGALVDLNGNVVGINASIRSTSSSSDEESGSIGLGFAIPVDEVMPIIEQMIKGQTPTHARLGISVSDVPASGSSGSQGGSGSQGDGSQGDGSQGQGGSGEGGSQGQGGGQIPGFPSFPGFGDGQGDGSGGSGGSQGQGGQGDGQDDSVFTTLGALVKDVNKGSAAQKAGIKTGDIITKVDDHVIEGSDSLVATVRAYRPGNKVTVTWTSGGKTKSAQIVLDSDASSSTS